LLKVYYYAEITATSGQISKPQGATILLNQWSTGEDALVCKIVNGKPDFQDTEAYVDTFDVDGNYTLSGALPSNPAALIYVFEIKRIDFDTYVDNYFVLQYLETDIAHEIHNANSKATPVDTDELGIWDTITGLLAKLTFANLKTTLKAYFDIIYESVLISGTNIKTINYTTLLGAGNIAVQPTLVSGVNLKTVGGNTLLGSTDIPVTNIVWHGAYDNAHPYIINDGVSYLGSSYICKLVSTGNLPTNNTYWDILAQMGNPGVSGLTGAVTTPFTNQTSVTVNHNFGGYPAVQVIDDNGAVLIPLTIVHASVNAFTVTFAISTSGNIVCTIGGVSSAVVTKSSDYTIVANDNLINVLAACTITLPLTSGLQGKKYYIKHIANNGDAVIVNTTGSKTIDGDSTKTLVVKYSCMLVFTDGTNWFIL
jgi:hypothetical protein